ncbi:MAG: glutathione S-transferase [Rhodobacteraceae bacterium]|nr:glutathione S-transferase [Paracoccaceae bacterium]
MKLTYSGTSPYVRKVMVMLAETGQRDKVELETVTVSPLKPGEVVPGINPLGKIPCLILDDTSALFDSRVICRYLDTMHDGAKLYPEGSTLWPRLAIEAAADGVMEAAILMVYEQRLRPEAERSPGWVEAQWLKVSRTLAWLDKRAESFENLDMAGIAVGCALGYLDFRHDDRQWRSLAPKLARWEAEFSKRPSMQATQPA